uniref:C-type lectin domain-containing protein n=1 Tax=Rhabditophanes sp. KR3021 TaxID=114890 RepID=A0AC35TGS7_9BILA
MLWFACVLVMFSSTYGCIYRGNTYSDGQEWVCLIIGNNKYLKKCTFLKDERWHISDIACLTSDQKKILPNDEYFENPYVKKCTNVTGSWDLKNVACLTRDKRRIPISVEWTEDKSVVKKCDRSADGFGKIKTIGCMTSDQRTIPANGEWNGDSYVHKCTILSDGSLKIENIACLTNEERRIPVDGEWNENSYVKKCTILSDGSLQIENIACFTPDQIIVTPNKGWFENTNFKKCIILTNGSFQIETMDATACLKEDQKSIPANGKSTTEGRFITECILSNGVFGSKITACLTIDGKRVEADEEWVC